MKKTLTIFTAALMIFSFTIFTACDEESNNSSNIQSTILEDSSSLETESISEDSNSSEIVSVSIEDSIEIDQTAEKIQAFYDLVTLSKKALDIVAEDVYSYWYSSIYGDAYENDIDVAINAALSDNSELISSINENDVFIVNLYKDIRDSELSTEIKAVMSVYLDYYDFAINVSGSFKDFKEKIDPLQKEFDDALKALFLEM